MPERMCGEFTRDDLSDFTNEIANQVESFVLAVREIALGGGAGRRPSLSYCCSFPNWCSRGVGWGRSRTSCPMSSSSRTPGSTPMSKGCAPPCATCSIRSTTTPPCLRPVRLRAARGGDAAAVRRDRGHRLPTSPTAWCITAPADSSRPCGGGSSRICRIGVRPRCRSCVPCTPSSRTCGSTPRSTRRCWSRIGCSPRPPSKPSPSTDHSPAPARARPPAQRARPPSELTT